ncbi:hypothetical protein Hypma_012255 [Hypsizygus marmoreus]|uniref:Protein kinase domain-containing protein n=1 Tax=Hypsizygus marmoreus TaxID=39966 RepID=A0A369JFE3_HYPMA|nr:hypothetical protein Hypma_012255 [Hypsizygus marmoreus]
MVSTGAPKPTMNSVSSILMHGAATAGNGQPISLILKRQFPALDLIATRHLLCCCKLTPCKCLTGCIRPGGAPVRVNVAQPPAPTADIHLEFTLDKHIDSGKSGIVNSTTLSSLSSPAHAMVPFVVKFAVRKRNKNLLREAWFYDELQSLQGSTIPRCYGYFEGELPEGCTFAPWKTVEDLRGEKNYEELEDKYFDALYGAFNPAYRSTLARFETAACVTVLLLEPLGGPFLEWGMKAAELDKAITQVRIAYRDISQLGVHHGDVRRPNILAVTKSSTSNPSPISGETYPFRIIDFEWAQKSDYSDTMIRSEHEVDLEPIRERILISI